MSDGVFWGPGAPLCVHLTGSDNGLYCSGTTQQQALATMRTADRLCRLSRVADPTADCSWGQYAAPTQGLSGLPPDLTIPPSQCQSKDYCAVRGSLAPLAPAYAPPLGQSRYQLVNPATSPPYIPRALVISKAPSTGCPVNLAPAEQAIGPPSKFCAAIPPS